MERRFEVTWHYGSGQNGVGGTTVVTANDRDHAESALKARMYLNVVDFRSRSLRVTGISEIYETKGNE